MLKPFAPTVLVLLLSLHYSTAAISAGGLKNPVKTLWQASKAEKKFVIDEYKDSKIASEAESLTGQELIDYVNSHQTLWKAERNKFDLYSNDVKYGLLGVNQVKLSVKDKKNLSPSRYFRMNIPESFDAREKWPECASLRNIRDQSSCGSCWAIAAVEAMSDRICIMSNGKAQVTLSAEDLLSCSAWKYWVSNGIVTGSNYTTHSGCQPYPFPPCEHHNNKTHYEPCKHDLYPTPKCEKKCSEDYGKSYKEDKYYGRSAYVVESNMRSIQKEILMMGPVEASFEVYTDFLNYAGGIYKHTAGAMSGMHAVKMLGWGVQQGVPYWLMANSWNTDWGEGGYFRILRGVDECGIESGIVAGQIRSNPQKFQDETVYVATSLNYLFKKEADNLHIKHVTSSIYNFDDVGRTDDGKGLARVPAQGGIAGTFDPNYQTMAGLGNDVFGADKEGVGGTGGGAAVANVPKAPTQGGIAGTYDPNYQTMAGLGNEVFGGDKGGGGTPVAAANAMPQPRAPTQGGIAGKHTPSQNLEHLKGVELTPHTRKITVFSSTAFFRQKEGRGEKNSVMSRLNVGGCRAEGKRELEVGQTFTAAYWIFWVQCSKNAPEQKTRWKPILWLYQKEYDPVTFDLLKVRPENIASQITLIDVPLFKAVTSQELLTGGWTKRNKHVDASNIVAFTDRFNSVCLWCQQEILSHEKVTKRAEVLEHFIKIAKHLYGLNNLNSTFAIVSALQSLSIYRLTKTWRLIGRTERGVFAKLQLLFDSESNWGHLRQHLNSLTLPCIPYLGLYLTDLNFIVAAHGTAKKDYTESEKIDRKKDDILYRISYFQKSSYGNLKYMECLQKYLQSFKFHEELTKFAEEDLFKLSLVRESDVHCPASSSPVAGFLRYPSLSRTLLAFSRLRSNLSAFEKSAQSLTPHLSSERRNRRVIVSDHRRARSLGADVNSGAVNLSFPFDADLVDLDVVAKAKVPSISFSNIENSTHHVNQWSSFPPLETSTPLRLTTKLSPKAPFSSFGRKNDADRLFLIDSDVDEDYKIPDFEGEVTVVVVRKWGSRPTMMKCSRKCYLELRSANLQQFCRRTVSIRCKSNRNAYYKKASKILKLGEGGWCIIHCVSSSEPSFEMHHPPSGRIYRYICKSSANAAEWYVRIRAAIQNALPRAPSNLITFD
uniref:Ras-GEF domain-containing protein n=1 Tax=Setaria digitata TaxID=48799 RepID=A0A915Q7B8_9BILA